MDTTPQTMELCYDDERLQTQHLALYFALFDAWSQHVYANPFPIDAKELMQMAKIDVLSDYVKCLQELKNWRYLEYNSNGAPQLASRVYLYTCSVSGSLF